MRCDCCNKQLTDAEATARFADSGNFVNMCKECRGFLPKGLKVLTRSDLEKEESYEDTEPRGVDDFFDIGEYDE